MYCCHTELVVAMALGEHTVVKVVHFRILGYFSIGQKVEIRIWNVLFPLLLLNEFRVYAL